MDEQKPIKQKATSQSEENWFWKITTAPGFFIGLMLILSILLYIITKFREGNPLSDILLLTYAMPMGLALFLGFSNFNVSTYIFIAIWLEIITASILVPKYRRNKGIILKTLIIITLIVILFSFIGCAVMSNTQTNISIHGG